MNRRETREGGGSKHVPLVAVAIDKDKGSQNALKWALDNVVTSKGESITLVHINTNKASSSPSEDGTSVRDIFVPFRIFCKRKDVSCHDIVLDDTDIAKALIDFISQAAIEKMILGASSKSFMRFKSADVPANVLRSAPDFCTVYVISKSKVSSMRKAVRDAPSVSPLRTQIENQNSMKQETVEYQVVNALRGEHARENRNNFLEKEIVIKSPFTRPGAPRFPARSNNGTNSRTESDISYVSSGRPSTDGGAQRLSYVSVDSFDLPFSPLSSTNTIGMFSHSSESSISQTMMGDDSETEMSRLRLELKQMMDMYNTACKEALDAKKQMSEYRQWKSEEENRLLEAKRAQEAALEMIEKERAKCRAAIEAAEKAKQIAEIEAQKRIRAERKAMEEAEERWRAMANLKHVEVRYRMYTIDEIQAATDNFSPSKKVGEGGYGPVYKCYLDHTPVAVKVLRPDASQGRSQFQQEVEILSCIRHPNMVLLLGACPENGCLVYEYMANGSLEDRLFMKENTPPIPWQHRFRIAAEISTGLLFLHQSKPEPLVHRDLKPANILLDKNYVSKISDVGLARLVPPSVADTVTQYHMTSAAGTFCYIDPEYQQTGMLGTKSDIYSFGVILLQLLTGRPPMGITHHMESALEQGTLSELLDPTVPDWPMEDTEIIARLALKCTELRRKDRPDLATVILPELNRMRDIGEANMHHCPMGPGTPSFMSSLTSAPDYTTSDSESLRSK